LWQGNKEILSDTGGSLKKRYFSICTLGRGKKSAYNGEQKENKKNTLCHAHPIPLNTFY
jgi:hypothetical protein